LRELDRARRGKVALCFEQPVKKRWMNPDMRERTCGEPRLVFSGEPSGGVLCV
jgi:hypothetical protein